MNLAIRFFLTSLFLIAFPSFALAGADCNKDDSRYEDLGCARKILESSDKELGEVYNTFLANVGKDGKDKLEKSQRAWVQFRNADAALAYQHSGVRGSVGELIVTNHKIDLARVRIGQLKYILHGLIESTYTAWDCVIGRSSLSTAATRLKSSEAISLATRAAEKEGLSLVQYRQASICFDASENQWTVFFDGYMGVPGNHFLVWIEDSTGATKIMHGE